MLARLADRYAILRSVWHGSDTHGVGVHYNLTGLRHAPRSQRRAAAGPPRPAEHRRASSANFAATATACRRRSSCRGPSGDQNNAMWAGQHAGFLGPKYDPLFLFDETWQPGDPLPGFTAPAGVDAQRQAAALELAEGDRRATRPTAEPRPSAITSGSSSSPSTCCARDRPGRRFGSTTSRSQILRPLRRQPLRPKLPGRPAADRGRRRASHRAVDVQAIGAELRHAQQELPQDEGQLLPPVDRAFSALLEDLEQRGTAGRDAGGLDRRVRPHAEDQQRRRPRPLGPRLFDGAGRRRRARRAGLTVAATSRAASPADNPVHVSDFFATMYHALGYGPDTRVTDPTGRPFFVVQGKPVLELF